MSDRHYWGRDSYEENSLEAYRDFMVAREGTYGRPDLDQGPRNMSAGAIERARAMMTWGSDSRLRSLAAQFNKFLKW
jgi:hypothetical protein